MANRIHWIVRDLSGKEDDVEPKLFRAKYASLDEAEAQFDHDLAHGVPVVRIEDAKGNTVREG
jgi:hypothetical protein